MQNVPGGTVPNQATQMATTMGPAGIPGAPQQFPTAAEVIAGPAGPGQPAPSIPNPTVPALQPAISFPWSSQPQPAASGSGVLGPPPTQIPPHLAQRLFGNPSLQAATAPPPKVPSLRSLGTTPTAHANAPRGVFETRNTVRGKKAVNASPLAIKKWALIPDPAIEEMTSGVKYAASQVGLVKYITILRNFTPEQVHFAIRDAYPMVDFDLTGYE